MYASSVAHFPVVSYSKYTDKTDGRTPDRYIMLSAMDADSVIIDSPPTAETFK